jgi:hypothetical protein
MKKILLLLAFSAGALSTFAQTASKTDGGKFSIGIDAGLPTGNANNYSDFAIGGDLKYALAVAGNWDLSLSAGYTSFLGKTITVDGISTNAGDVKGIPVKFAGRYNFDGNAGFFAEAAVGAAFIQDGGGTTFLYAPGIGYALKNGFEIGARYEGWSNNGTVSQVALRAAYSF